MEPGTETLVPDSAPKQISDMNATQPQAPSMEVTLSKGVPVETFVDDEKNSSFQAEAGASAVQTTVELSSPIPGGDPEDASPAEGTTEVAEDNEPETQAGGEGGSSWDGHIPGGGSSESEGEEEGPRSALVRAIYVECDVVDPREQDASWRLEAAAAEPTESEVKLANLWSANQEDSSQEVLARTHEHHMDGQTVVVRSVLCEPTVESAREIAKKLEGCDVVLFADEATFRDEFDQKAYGQAYTQALKDYRRPDQVRAVLAEDAVGNDNAVAAVVYGLRESSPNATVEFVGFPADRLEGNYRATVLNYSAVRPEWDDRITVLSGIAGLYDKTLADQFEAKLDAAVTNLESFDTAKATSWHLLMQQAQYDELTERRVALQIGLRVQAAAEQPSEDGKPKKLGVVMRPSRALRVGNALGLVPVDDIETERENALKIPAAVPLLENAQRVMRGGGTQRANALLDRHLLSRYVARLAPIDEAATGADRAAQERTVFARAQRAAEDLAGFQMVEYISGLTSDLKIENPTEREQKLRERLAPLIDKIRA